MRIALLHDHYDQNHLEEVKQQMLLLGSPEIKCVWMECYGHWAALEGCHRIRAAKDLGLPINIVEVEYSDEVCDTDLDHDYTIAEIADGSYKSTILDV